MRPVPALSPSNRQPADQAAPTAYPSFLPPTHISLHPQLKPGYDGVPRLLAAFEKGIPHKVAADPAGQLVFFGSTEVGEDGRGEGGWGCRGVLNGEQGLTQRQAELVANCRGRCSKPSIVEQRGGLKCTYLQCPCPAGMLNNVIELWRYPSAQACHDA